jgi:hypothetical protein
LVSGGHSRGEFGSGMWRTETLIGFAVPHVDLSHGLGTVEVRWHVARWRLAAAAGCFHPSTSPCEDLGPTSLCQFDSELSRDSCGIGRRSSRGETKCSPLTLRAATASVAVQIALRHWVDIGLSFGRMPNLALALVSATTASSDVLMLVDGIYSY